MLSIQTNVNSLVAQENMSVNNAFQSKTIQRLTSGYRINSSGDDAAGLAVANKFRNMVSELTQGVANGNDGVAQLQIMDGGMSNISQILDRLKTLAMQSASQTFTGNRATLNSEFQTDIAEIDRQAQSIGLNTGGTFAKSLAVYLGAGSGSTAQANSTVSVDLSKATVDSQSLGLTGFTAMKIDTVTPSNDYDLGAASSTSVNTIVTNANNVTNEAAAGYAKFVFYGPGFGDTSGVTVSVNLSGVGDTASLVSNINTAIQSAQSTAGGNYAAFKTANITAAIHTDSLGRQQLSFSSANTAFQVNAGDGMANALLGNFSGTAEGNLSTVTGSSLVALGAYELATPASGTTPNTENDLAWSHALTSGWQKVTISAVDAGGVSHQLVVNITSTQQTAGAVATAINSALQTSNDSTLQQITAVQVQKTGETGAAGNASHFNFISTLKDFTVAVTANSSGDATAVGLSALNITASPGNPNGVALQVGTGGAADISTLAGAQQAVTSISAAVASLGTAQAAVGKGQNTLGYAINLAQSQIVNLSAAQSQIRDANVAAEAANLTKAQVLQQAAIAAMAQANSAPQAILSLLRG